MPRFSLTVLAVLVLATTAVTEARARPLVVVEAELVENPLEGTPRLPCRVVHETDAGKVRHAWFAFGSVRHGSDHGWQPVAPTTHCGSGSFDGATVLGVPYVIVELETTATVLSGGRVSLETSRVVAKLARFDAEGRPVYSRGDAVGATSSAVDEAVFAILLADDRESEAFGIHEVLLRLRPTVLDDEPLAEYGAISVTADAPGMTVLLDGSPVGRTVEHGATVLSNVLVGEHEVRVRDISGREAGQRIVVEPGRAANAALEVLNLPDAAAGAELVPVGKNPQGSDEYWRPRDRALMVRVPGGEFLMGSPDGEGEAVERPQRQVVVAEFVIDKTETTWRQFRTFAEATGRALPAAPLWGTPDDYPVSNVSWEDARDYCDWLGGRLPREEEWEKAARGTDGRDYPWGNEWDPSRCNSLDGGPHRPENVGSYPSGASPYGVLDLAGSMWEWCADRFGGEGGAAEMRVLRGGGWIAQPSSVRTAQRHRADASWRHVHHGFRCVDDAPIDAAASVAAATPAGPAEIELSLEVIASPGEASTGATCAIVENVVEGRKMQWWAARPAARVLCAAGESPPADMAFVVTASTVARSVAGGFVRLEISFAAEELSGFEATGEPVYARSTHTRALFLADGDAMFIPLDRFGEVVVRAAARRAHRGPRAAFGTVSVASELGGADLLLDGGVVGRIQAGGPSVLRNVTAGAREVRVRGSAEKDAQRLVRVEEGRTVLVALTPGSADRSGALYDLTALGRNAQGYEEYRRERDGARLVKIPAGEFLMGHAETERAPLEHRVYLSDFMIDRTEVSWKQYRSFAEATGTPLPPHDPYWGIQDDHPAVFVTWEEAKGYCDWIGGRLPTEAEWEKAARGTDGRKYPWGNEEPDPERAVFRRSWGLVSTDPVGAHPTGASFYGLLDAAGNVWEWCADWYDGKYYEVSPKRDPQGPGSGMARVVRGGSWDSRPAVLSGACRGWGRRSYREGDFGFRCAMDLPGSERSIGERGGLDPD